MLEHEAKRLGYALSQLTKPEYLEALFKRYSFQNMDDVYLRHLGFGGLSTHAGAEPAGGRLSQGS